MYMAIVSINILPQDLPQSTLEAFPLHVHGRKKNNSHNYTQCTVARNIHFYLGGS